MKIATSVLATCALLALPAAAGAGQCTSEIDSLSKTLAANDAGSGPTPGTAATTAGQHPPTVAMSEQDQSGAASRAAAESGQPQHPPTAVMNRETTGMSPSSGESDMRSARTPDEHPPTATMNQAMQGGAASAQDVQRQNQGQKTAATAATQDPKQDAKTDIAQSHTMAGAMAALERARMLDQQGQETECLSAVGQAKLITGAR
jgi:hypothetical protein